jgi:dienelactone hydrolase
MHPNMIGAYGPWAAALLGDGPAALSFRNPEWNDLEAWRPLARQRLLERLAQPEMGDLTPVNVRRQWVAGGPSASSGQAPSAASGQALHVEDLRWQLPYGPPTQAIFIKPAGAGGRLPAVLALHDHALNKYFGALKIARTGDPPHPLMLEHQAQYYGGVAWANELARRGYAVLVPDAFPFASRRVRLEDVPEEIREGLRPEAQPEGQSDPDPETPEAIAAYNRWAAQHETIMAKSLLCAGTTWPGVWLAEDRVALDILCARDDVDPERVGCGGLSGGGMRTVFLAGSDPRISCAVCAGMLTTWRDWLLYKSYTHTWMVYVPLLPRDLDYPEILGLRAPLPTLVQNNLEDELFTPSEMERAADMLGQVYAKAGAGDAYRCTFYPGPHKFDRDMQAEAFDWFDRWLKP